MKEMRKESSKTSMSNLDNKTRDWKRVERNPSQPSDSDTSGNDISIRSRFKLPLKDILF